MMPTSSVGRITRRATQRGVTLLEMLIVMTIIALVAGVSFPSVASGLDSLRLRSASDTVVTFFNTALTQADRHQQVVEIWISPHDNALTARSAGSEFIRRVEIPPPIRIVSVLPPPIEGEPDQPRRFLLYPGGAVPRIGVEIAYKDGRHRTVSIDPITGVPRSELKTQ